MKLQVIHNILSRNIDVSADFYQRLIGLEIVHRSDWYVVLATPGTPEVMIGLIDTVGEFTPRQTWGSPAGHYLTLVVPNVFETLERAREMEVEIMQEPVELAYGHTRALIRDPSGTVLDLSTPNELVAQMPGVDFERLRRNSVQEPVGRGFDTDLL